ncbi:RNA-directed RNA polymerase L, partial [Clarias magur]
VVRAQVLISAEEGKHLQEGFDVTFRITGHNDLMLGTIEGYPQMKWTLEGVTLL